MHKLSEQKKVKCPLTDAIISATQATGGMDFRQMMVQVYTKHVSWGFALWGRLELGARGHTHAHTYTKSWVLCVSCMVTHRASHGNSFAFPLSN